MSKFAVLRLTGTPLNLSVRLNLLMQILGREFRLADLPSEMRK